MVGVGDRIKDQALVVRIERRRVVLRENGAPRELTLDEDDASRPLVQRPPAARRRSAARERRAAARVPR